jgi:hypothetical protein
MVRIRKLPMQNSVPNGIPTLRESPSLGRSARPERDETRLRDAAMPRSPHSERNKSAEPIRPPHSHRVERRTLGFDKLVEGVGV